MLEGYGGPVHVQEYDNQGIDPTLESCCAREILSNRRQAVVEQAIRKHDRIAMAERRRRHVMNGLSWGDGCRCSYDPSSDGGEYIALIEARQRRCENNNNPVEETNHDNYSPHEKNTNKNNNNYYDDDSDDDSEFDYLLDEDIPIGGAEEENNDNNGSLLRQMEEERRAELEWQVMYQETLKHHGYGEHRQMHPQRLLTATFSKRSIAPAVVLHLYDPNLDMCGELDLILEDLAHSGNYRGTKFMRSNGSSTLIMNADLIQNYIVPTCTVPDIGFVKVTDLPAIIAVKDGNVVAVASKLYGLGSMSDGTVDERTVEHWLYQAGVLLQDPPSYFDMCSIRPEEDALHENMMREKEQQQKLHLQQIQEQIFNCGVKGCNKTYHHKHIGITNDEQDGKLLSEDQQQLTTTNNTSSSSSAPPPQSQEIEIE